MIAFWSSIILKMLRRRLRRAAIMLMATALAVACLVVLGAIMEGVGDTMIRNSVAAGNGHMTLTWQGAGPIDTVVVEQVSRWGGVAEALPRRSHAVLLTAGQASAPVALVGVVPREQGYSVAAAKIVRGGFPLAKGAILLGSGVAGSLGVGVGSRVQAVDAEGAKRTFTVCGVFESHQPQLDGHSALVALEDVPAAQEVVAVFLDDPYAAATLMARATVELPSLRASQWQQDLPELAGLISLNRFSMRVVLALALMILALGISNNVFQSVGQRRRELSILRAMGLTGRGVTALVLGETMVIACCAAAIGAGVGAIATGLWSLWGLDLGAWTSENSHFLISAVVYPRLTAGGIVAPAAVACACGLLASALPARRAGRAAIVEGLRSL